MISPGYVNTQLSHNAITGDGTNYGKTDETTAKGMSPEFVAKTALMAIAEKEVDVVMADVKSNLAIILKTLFPTAFSRIIQKKV